MENWFEVVATSAVIAAVVSGIFGLFAIAYENRRSLARWRRDEKYATYSRLIALVNELTTLSDEVEFDELLRLQAKIELLITDQKLARQVHNSLEEILELYHNRPSRKVREIEEYHKALEKDRRTLTRLLRSDLK